MHISPSHFRMRCTSITSKYKRCIFLLLRAKNQEASSQHPPIIFTNIFNFAHHLTTWKIPLQHHEATTTMYTTLIRLLLPLLITLTLTHASPTPITSTSEITPLNRRLIESAPWQLNNLRIFSAAPGTPGMSYITFTFVDSGNDAALDMTTSCKRYIAPQSSLGEASGAVTTPVFSTCANATVGWSYDGKTVSVQRSYVDVRYVLCLRLVLS